MTESWPPTVSSVEHLKNLTGLESLLVAFTDITWTGSHELKWVLSKTQVRWMAK